MDSEILLLTFAIILTTVTIVWMFKRNAPKVTAYEDEITEEVPWPHFGNGCDGGDCDCK